MSAQGKPTGAQRVSAGRVPLFCDTALAGRIERVEAQLIARSSEAARRRVGTAGFVIPIAGGVASMRSSRARRSSGPSAIWQRRAPCATPRCATGPSSAAPPAHGRRRRTAQRGGGRTCAPSPECAYRAAVGPARRRPRRWLRRRRHHHPARIEVPAERTTPGLRPALCPCRSGQAALNPHTCDLAGLESPPATRAGRPAVSGHGPSTGRETVMSEVAFTVFSTAPRMMLAIPDRSYLIRPPEMWGCRAGGAED